jgi:hypothetical protein
MSTDQTESSATPRADAIRAKEAARRAGMQPAGPQPMQWVEDPDDPFYVEPELREEYLRADVGSADQYRQAMRPPAFAIDYRPEVQDRDVAQLDGTFERQPVELLAGPVVEAPEPIPYPLWQHQQRLELARRRHDVHQRAEANAMRSRCPTCDRTVRGHLAAVWLQPIATWVSVCDWCKPALESFVGRWVLDRLDDPEWIARTTQLLDDLEARALAERRLSRRIGP